ncbi:MAG TPA: Gfo/Idh/MocA family oxidoreductase [Vicinamibacterales bacterium]|nr:Gfo/Idh/MocA family oxidoreductase [Vicinamibacterales bacterium]
MNRRVFLSKTAAATVGFAAAFPARARGQKSPNETINVAIIGLRGDNKGHPTWTARGRGQDHYQHLAAIPNVRITHVVDVDERHFGDSLSFVRGKWGGDPKTETDFRRILDNREVDAVTIAAPDHWHALMTIWACQAGKDVYVEKPVSHNLVEGRRMIEAARRYGRVVAVGTQRRSSAALARAVQFVREGGLGTLYGGKTIMYRYRDPIGVATNGPVPPGVHYDRWLGPAPARPFNANHFHYHWHWFWEYGTSDLGNTGVHSIDAARWLLGKDEHPRTAHSMGGLHEAGAPTDQVTPNTQQASWQYADGTQLQCEVRNWYSGPPEAQGIFIFGSKGWMRVGDDGAQVYFGRKNEPGPKLTVEKEPDAGQAHFENFIGCIRTRQPQNLGATIADGHLSTALCHLGNISCRLRRSVTFDGTKERFVGDEEADALLGRTYRAPYLLPERP